MRRARQRLALVLLAWCFALPAHAERLDYVRDLIVQSAPGAPTNHEITFTTIQDIPASGVIELALQRDVFEVPPEFDYTDVDLALMEGTTSVDRPIAAAPSVTDDGVSVTTGSDGVITITLSSGSGIPAGSKVRVRLGTNAVVGDVGTSKIINPTEVGSYRIDISSHDSAGTLIDFSSAMIAVINSVGLNAPLPNIAPVILSSSPSGTLAAGNSNIELSLRTDKLSSCRWSATPGVAYQSMTNSFSPRLSTVFYTVIGGHQDGTAYTYYVRCVNQQNGANPTDYLLSFALAPTPISNTSVTQQAGAVIGSGPYVNGSTVLYQASVSLSGLTAPGNTVTVLRDGSQAAAVQGGSDGTFTVSIPNLERGTYTFMLYGTDPAGSKTASYSSTFGVNPATNNAVSGILLSPTLRVVPDTVGVGESIQLSGTSVPGSRIDVTVYPPPEATNATAQQFTASTTGNGVWQVSIASGERTAGTYTIRARATVGSSQSDLSRPAYVGVGGKPSAKNGGLIGDLNGDGKVNLVDFSILLTYWNATGIADLNSDGTVNLADFSIMLFNWTG